MGMRPERAGGGARLGTTDYEYRKTLRNVTGRGFLYKIRCSTIKAERCVSKSPRTARVGDTVEFLFFISQLSCFSDTFFPFWQLLPPRLAWVHRCHFSGYIHDCFLGGRSSWTYVWTLIAGSPHSSQHMCYMVDNLRIMSWTTHVLKMDNFLVRIFSIKTYQYGI